MATATSPRARSSTCIPSGSSSSILPGCRPPRTSYTCSSELTEPPRSPSRNALQRLTERPPQRSCDTFLRPCLTRPTPFRATVAVSLSGSLATGTSSALGAMRFDTICEANRIEHWLTKPKQSSANGQVKRMNRTIKEAHQAVPLRNPRPVARTHYGFSGGLRLRQSDQDPWLPYAIRIHPQKLDIRVESINLSYSPKIRQ